MIRSKVGYFLTGHFFVYFKEFPCPSEILVNVAETLSVVDRQDPVVVIGCLLPNIHSSEKHVSTQAKRFTSEVKRIL